MYNFKADLATQLVRKHGSPFYVYDLSGLKNRIRFVKKQLSSKNKIFYAMKANNHPAILKLMQKSGFGVDVVSQGEITRALKCGFKPSDIVFSGVGKSTSELTKAIQLKIRMINVESVSELERILRIALRLKTRVNVSLRVNPDVLTNTHPYIRTGFRENKFGIDFSNVAQFSDMILKNQRYLCLYGIALHIGSQICDTAPFIEAIKKTLILVKNLKKQGHKIKIFDVGGGVGINYNNHNIQSDEKLIKKYFYTVNKVFKNKFKSVYFEPGRMLVARFGYLITEVQYIKITPYKKFVIVDAGMNHLMRPALYQAEHRIAVASMRDSGSKATLFDVVGPICESADVLGKKRWLPKKIQSGDLLVIYDVGAYGAVMASDYNLRPRAKEIAINFSEWNKDDI